jgi:hypothetical protein
MNWKLAIVLVALAVAVAAFFYFKKPGPRAVVEVTLRLAVSPVARTEFVVAQANSARFKYEMGKQAGVKPVLAQKLAVQTVPNTAVVEVRLGVETREEARLYAEAFVETLRAQCGAETQISLINRSVR